ncbi:MAG TPA: hypothetical protein VK825_19605 [Xanthobacteraceae bacterium]|nr:hypothetical protein [Xanthobacteraceae bacterium]
MSEGPNRRLFYLYVIVIAIALPVLAALFIGPITRQQFRSWLAIGVAIIMIIGFVGPRLTKFWKGLAGDNRD